MRKQYGSGSTRNFCPPTAQILRPGGGAAPDGFQGYPVALSAQATLNPAEPIDLPPEAFTNQTAFPIDIYSMRWIIDANGPNDPVNAVANLSTVVAGAGIQAMIRLGDTPLTAQFVPLYLFGQADSQIAEQQIVQSSDTGGEIPSITDGGSLCSGEWKLDYPLTIDPGESIQIRLFHTSLVSRTVTVTLVLAGRGGFSGQNRSRRRLPYVSAWLPTPFDPAVTTSTRPTTITSTPRDLTNKSGGPLQVRRFVGRLLRTYISPVPNASFDAVVSPQTLAIPFGDITVPLDALMTLVMNDSRGNAVVAAGANGLGAPFRLVFEPTTRTWEVPHVLDPEDYYLAQLTLNPPVNAGLLGSSVQPAIAMIGYQEGL